MISPVPVNAQAGLSIANLQITRRQS